MRNSSSGCETSRGQRIFQNGQTNELFNARFRADRGKGKDNLSSIAVDLSYRALEDCDVSVRHDLLLIFLQVWALLEAVVSKGS
jgi:hypothetical protein